MGASYLTQTAKISGFGGIQSNRTKEENPVTCSLKEAYLKVFLLFDMTFLKFETTQVASCEKLLPDAKDIPLNHTKKPYPKDWRSKKICLHHGSVLPPATACSGDSGGPLIVNEGGYSVVMGVASLIFDPNINFQKQEPTRCGGAKTVSTYAEVQAYLPWIKSIIGQGQNTI